MWTLGINVFYRRTLHISHSNFAWCVIISGICSEQSIVWLEAFVARFILQAHLNTGNTYSNYIWWIILYIFFYFCRGHLDIPLLQNLNENKKRRLPFFIFWELLYYQTLYFQTSTKTKLWFKGLIVLRSQKSFLNSFRICQVFQQNITIVSCTYRTNNAIYVAIFPAHNDLI